MSLRGFHIFFLTVITLFFALVAAWGFTAGIYQDAKFWNIVSWVSVATAVITPCYGVYFITKAKVLYS